jgi:prophage regulatory protein
MTERKPLPSAAAAHNRAPPAQSTDAHRIGQVLPGNLESTLASGAHTARADDSATNEFASTPSGFVHPSDPVSTTRPRSIRLLRLPQVIELVGLRRAAIYKLQSEGRFPRRVKLGVRAVGWVEAEIQEWLAERIQESHSFSPAAQGDLSSTRSDSDE